MYNTLNDTHGKVDHLKEASKLFSKMLKELYSLMEKLEEICYFPDTRTYNILMQLHAQNDNIDEVFCYFTKMMGYQTTLHAFCIKHMVSKVEVIVKDMNALGIHVDEDSQ
jgi:pentatricopeptide repeat protein